mgnify:CR=1 FL=1
MKKIIPIFIALVASTSFAQDQESHDWCGFDHQFARYCQEHPGAEQEIAEHTYRSRELGEQFLADRDRSVVSTVPVVVHVLHDGGSSNISYDQVLSAIDQLNEDWRRLHADTVNTRNTAEAPFLPHAADMEIEFKLAKIDPDGNCTNGVERRLTDATFNANDGNAKHYSGGGLDAWPRDSYFNIWVVSTIESGGAGITLGYAQFPSWGAASEYGLVIRNDRFGTIGTATNGDRTLAHEVGHCMGLFHTFQGGWGSPNGCHTSDCSSNGDGCCDTPPVSEAQWSCSNTQNTCTGVPSGDTYGFDAYDQFENFMSYSPCQNMFSQDQKSIVYGNISSISWLQDLMSPANLVATGVNNPDALCKAEFSSTNNFICAGGSVTFEDLSYFNVTGVQWTFDGGTPANSTNATETVTYDTPGVYDVTLTVTDGTSNETTTEVAYVTVISNPGAPIPYHEGFEDITSIPDDVNWWIVDEDGTEPWDLNTSFGSSGNNSVWLDNFGETDQTKDHLISQPLDLSGVDPADNIVFNFKYAYKKRSPGNDEWLRFFVSQDCGETWVLRKNMHGDGLNSVSDLYPFEPTLTDWMQGDVTNINSAYYVSNFRFKFEFENDSGNNIYIDDINLYPGSMTFVEEEIADNLSVYPNPVSNMMHITFDVYDASFYNITLTNALGQQVANVFQGELLNGANKKISFDMDGLPQGVYFLNVESNGVVRTTKVMKQ